MPLSGLGKGEMMNTRGVEIDVQEHHLFGNDDNKFRSTIHWGGYNADHKMDSYTSTVAHLDEGFHTIAVRWDKRGYFFYVDGKYIHQVKAPVSNVPEYLLVTCSAMGQSEIDREKGKLPDSFIIDWVRVWQTPAQQAADQERKAQEQPASEPPRHQ